MAFDIGDLDSLILHLDAGTITGLSDGDYVGSWTDQSTTGATLTADEGEEAIYVSSAINSLPAVEFDGYYARLYSSTDYPSDVANIGIVAVTKLGTKKNYNGFFAFDSASPATDYQKISLWGSSGNDTYLYTLAGYTRIVEDLTVGWQIVTYVLGQNTMFSRHDGETRTSANSPPPGTWADNLSPTVGHVGLSDSFLDGQIAELVVFGETQLSESFYVEGELAAKYAISLQADHPFAGGAPADGPGGSGGGGGIQIARGMHGGMRG